MILRYTCVDSFAAIVDLYMTILFFLTYFILNHHGILLLLQILKLFLCDIIKHNSFAADKEIHNFPIFDHPQRSSAKEKWRTIGGRLIVVRYIVTQI